MNSDAVGWNVLPMSVKSIQYTVLLKSSFLNDSMSA